MQHQAASDFLLVVGVDVGVVTKIQGRDEPAAAGARGACSRLEPGELGLAEESGLIAAVVAEGSDGDGVEGQIRVAAHLDEIFDEQLLELLIRRGAADVGLALVPDGSTHAKAVERGEHALAQWFEIAQW